VIVGKPSFVMSAIGSAVQPEPRNDRLTEVWIAVDGALAARSFFGDAIRPDAARAIEWLKDSGWRVGMASGDAQSVVDAISAEVGIPGADAKGGAAPEEKLEIISRAAQRGPVVMVGDGVNDAAAIAAASVGIAVHGGAEASMAAADVYMTRPGLASLVELIEGSRRTLAVIRLGIWWSLGYNVIGATLAMSGLINPLVAAVMMPTSSLTVLLVAWKGRTFGEPGTGTGAVS